MPYWRPWRTVGLGDLEAWRPFFEKYKKCLELPDLVRSLIEKAFKIVNPPVTDGETFPLMSMGGREEGLVCADPVARTLLTSVANRKPAWLPGCASKVLLVGVC